MKKIGPILLLILFPISLLGQLDVSYDKSYDFGKDDRILGVDEIVILESIDSSATLEYVFTDTVNFEWYYHTPSDSLLLSSVQKDTIARLDSLKQGLYELKTDGRSYYFSVIDFSEYRSQLDSVWVEDEGDSCNTVRLFAHMARVEIPVYDKLSDSTHLLLEPITTYKWTNSERDTLSPLSQEAPLEDITYDCVPFSEDFFANNELKVLYKGADTLSTLPYTAIAVKMGTLDVRVPEEEGEINRFKASAAGKERSEGSAPLDVTYEVSPEGAVEYTNWWIWGLDVDQQPKAPTYRYEEQITHTFEKYIESGYRVKVEVGNDKCQVQDSSEVTVYTSDLKAPNILILGFGEAGKFKVAYQSIDLSNFKATVYDRWGRRIYSWDDPDLGWDGRSPVTDAYVSPGAYYCAVTARGTDGKKHDTIFEINVIREKGIR